MKNRTPVQIGVGKHLISLFGNGGKFRKWEGDEIDFSIDLVEFPDSYSAGISVHATVGLSNWELWHEQKVFPCRLELVTAINGTWPQFAAVLFETAAVIGYRKWFCHPGAVLEGAIGEHLHETTTRHLMFVPPSCISEELNQVREIGGEKVTWLLALPITEPERLFAIKNGGEALEHLLEDNDCPFWDLNRASVVT